MPTNSTPTAITPLITDTVPLLDEAMQALTRALGRVCRIHDGGAFWYPNGVRFWDAWRDNSEDGTGSLSVRMGRMELVIDWKAPRTL